MSYNVSFELASLLFLLIIFIRFFERRRFPDTRTRLFGFVLIAAVFDILLDIVGSFLIEYAEFAPQFTLMSVNTAFYAIQIAFPTFSMLYVLTIGGLITPKNKPYVSLLFIPSLFFEVLLLTNSSTEIFFYFNQSREYFHGEYYLTLFIGVAFYMVLSLFAIFAHRKRYTPVEFWTVLCYIVIVIACTVIQLYLPEHLLTGMAIAISVTIMFFTLQNPSDMLDSMTRVFNRNGLMQMLDACFQSNKAFQVIVVDINDMKKLNAVFGFQAGNQALIGIAKFLSGFTKEKNWVFRPFGDRFVIITRSADTHTKLLDKILTRFEKPWKISDSMMIIPATIFHISDGRFAHNSENMMTVFEAALPEMKKEHKGGSCRIGGEVLAYISRQDAVDAALRRAIEEDGFEIWLQPLYSPDRERFESAEALVRLNDRVLGRVSPSEFIPIAERQGLVTKIDEVVLRKVCSVIKEGVVFGPDKLQSIEVNLSAIEFMQQDLAEYIFGVVSEYGIDPSRIIFEITETTATASHDILSVTMNKMRQMGFRFALDDYGTGYSNLTRVISLPFVAIKLDRSMLLACFESESNSTVFNDTVAMMKKIGMITVVEGVETVEQDLLLRRLGVDYIQGYYYSQPLPLPDVRNLLEKSASSEKAPLIVK